MWDYIIAKEEKGWCLGDWLSPRQIYIDADYVNTCCLLLCCNIYLEYCDILGDFTDSKEIIELRSNVIKAINRHYYNSQTFEYDENKNGANLFAVVYGATNEENKQKVIDKAIEHYRLNPEVNTGIVGTRLLFDFLSNNGAKDVALKILTNKKYPSYGYMLSKGATTLWECWEEETTPDFFINKNEQMQGYPVSHNHPMFGSVNSWIFEKIAGFNIDHLDKGEIIINPIYIHEITKLSASQETVFGDVKVEYHLFNGIINFKVNIPVGLKATLIIDDHKHSFGSGEHIINQKEK